MEFEWLKQAEVRYYRLEHSHSNAVPQLKHNPWSLKCHQQHLQRMKENAKHRNQYSILSLTEFSFQTGSYVTAEKSYVNLFNSIFWGGGDCNEMHCRFQASVHGMSPGQVSHQITVISGFSTCCPLLCSYSVLCIAFQKHSYRLPDVALI